MAPASERARFAFLYRSEDGTIDAPVWRRAAVPVAALFALLTGLWLLVRPYAARTLDRRGFLDPAAIGANLFAIVYAFGVLLLGVAWVNLAAKRFRERGRPFPLGLAGLFPLAVLCDGALRWLQPQITDTLPRASVFFGDAVVIGVLAWTVAECGGFFARR